MDRISFTKLALIVITVIFISVANASANQQEQKLAIEVQTQLHATVINPIKPHLVFSSTQDANLWLNDMSNRLKQFANRNPELKDDLVRKRLLIIIQYEAVRAGLDPQIVLSLITIESRFDGDIISRAGAIGLMQVMPFWQRQIGTLNQNLLNIQTNIRYGCTILRYYVKLEHGSIYNALARYNGSTGQVKYPNLVFNAYNRYWKPKPTLD